MAVNMLLGRQTKAISCSMVVPELAGVSKACKRGCRCHAVTDKQQGEAG